MVGSLAQLLQQKQPKNLRKKNSNYLHTINTTRYSNDLCGDLTWVAEELSELHPKAIGILWKLCNKQKGGMVWPVLACTASAKGNIG